MAYRTDINRPQEPYALSLAVPADEPAAIRRQIDHTRDQMEITLSAIGERLSPDYLLAQAKSTAREATVGRIKDMKNEANNRMDEMSSSLGQTIRENPLPVALIGLGLSWLWMNKRNEAHDMADYRVRRYDYDQYNTDENGRFYRRNEWYDEPSGMERIGQAARNVGEAVSDTTHRATESATEAVYRAGEAVGEKAEAVQNRVGETADAIKDRVGETADAVQDRVGETAGAVQERVSETADRTREEAQRLSHEAQRLSMEAQRRGRVAVRRTRNTLTQTMEENPLMVAAVAVVAGLAAGAALPPSRYENELLGETRDNLLDEARVRAQDAVGRVQSVVEDTSRAVVSEAKESAQRHNLTIDDLEPDSGSMSGAGQANTGM